MHRAPLKYLAAPVAALLLVSAGTAAAQATLPYKENGRPTMSPVLKEITPAVVNISVTGRAVMRQHPFFDDPLFRRFFDVPQQAPSVPRRSVGSGVIIDAKNGYVLTNHHVIAQAEEIMVTLNDRRQFEAELVGSDEGTDVALLKIEPDDLTAIELGDSRTLEVGDFVMAIGNPFGIGQTVTSGIVSALGRSGINVEGYEDFIQTDASINPGNSGGALVDYNGTLIGINTAIIAPAGGNVGIGFAIPIHMADAVMQQLLEYGEVRRGRLGIVIQDVTPDLAEALDLAAVEGAVITQVQPDSAAENAGLEPGDVVVSVDGEPVTGSAALRNLIGLTRVGEEIRMSVLRNGDRRNIRARIGDAQPEVIAGGESLPKLNGATFRNLDRSHPRHGDVEGVLVAQVEQGSPAWRNGLRNDDVIIAVNRRRVSTVEQFEQALTQSGPAVALDILRGNMRLFVVIQ